MNKAAVFHRASDSMCYSPDGRHLVIRLSTAADDISSVIVMAGDPHDWMEAPGHAGGYAWRCHPHAAHKTGSDGIHDFWQIEWMPPYKRARYFFRLTAADGSLWDYGEKGIIAQGAGPADQEPAGDYWNAFVFPYINAVDVFRAPSWVEGTVWYQIFPERFRNGDAANDPAGTKDWHRGPVTNHEFYGGDLRGIIDGLDHVASLGCNGIYLTPIFLSPSVHKYDTADYLGLDPAFGTEAELAELVKACSDRGIRLILDAVFNHCGREFGPWRDVLKNGESSPYRDWFHIASFPLFHKGHDTGDSRDVSFETFAFTTGMPKLNTANPDVRAYLLDAAERYVRDYGISGWRLDVSNEVDHDFWRLFRARVKAANPDAYIVGEIWHDAMPWLRGDQYDAVMNYPVGTAISDFMLGRPWMASGTDLARRLAAIEFMYPEPVLRAAFNLLDSHDTDRIATRFGGRGQAFMALALLFSLRGSPCVYYGTEYAMEGGHDPDCRRCMVWDPDQGEHAFRQMLSALIRVRLRHSELLARGIRIGAGLDAYPGFVALGATLGGRSLVVMANRGIVPVPAAEWKACLPSASSIVELLGDQTFDRDLDPGALAVLGLE